MSSSTEPTVSNRVPFWEFAINLFCSTCIGKPENRVSEQVQRAEIILITRTDHVLRLLKHFSGSFNSFVLSFYQLLTTETQNKRQIKLETI